MTHLRGLIIPIGLLVAAPSEVAAQERATPSTNVIEGVVRTAEGVPLSGVSVTLVERNDIVITDVDGRFRFTGVPPGAYTLRVRRIGYLPEEHRIERAPGAVATVEIALIRHPLMLEEIVVEAGGRGLFGVVHGPGMEPIRSADVSGNRTARRIRTGDDGWFRVPDFPAGKHLLRVSADGYRHRFFSVTVPDDSIRVVSIQLTPGPGGRRDIARVAWDSYSFSRRWASNALVTTLTRDDLDRRPAATVLDVSDVRAQAGSSPCVYVDGLLSALPLDFFNATEVETVDVVPAHALFLNRQPFSRSRTGSRSIGARDPRSACTARVYIWLRSN